MYIPLDMAIRTYGKILGIYDYTFVSDIVEHLDQRVKTTTFFTDTVRKLDILYVNGNEVHSTRDLTRRPYQRIQQIAKGTNGRIYRVVDQNIVYKEIFLETEDPEELEIEIRETFLEIFIQTTLSLDANYGSHICTNYALFRSDKEDRLFVQMEYIPHGFRYCIKGERADIDDFVPILSKLSSVVSYFRTTYTFYHHDLHTENIMFSSDGTIKLIDFGMSCITFHGIQYSCIEDMALSIESEPRECYSYDLLIFISSFLTAYGPKHSTRNLYMFLHSLLYTKNGVNLYTYWKNVLRDRKETSPIFYEMYYWKIDKWDPDLKADLFATTDLLPEGIYSLCQKKLSTIRNGKDA